MKLHSIITFIVLFTCFTNKSFAADIPINIGIGPAYFLIPENIQEEQTPFYGLNLHIKAIIDKKTIEKNKRKIPANFHKAVAKVGEVRVGFILIPESIMIGARTEKAGLEFFGATWKPIALGIPLKMGPMTLTAGVGVIFTYAYINIGGHKIQQEGESSEDRSSFVDQVTHFMRPGADAGLNLEIKFSDNFLTSFGARSAYYIPQKIGGSITDIAEIKNNNIFRIHSAYAVLHYRFPINVKM